jgi:hypothetical protein
MIVKSFLLFAGLFFALTLSSSISSVSSASKLERAEVNFSSPVQLMGKTLQGNYIFVHNDEASARGETCTFVYRNSESPKNLVASFHCTSAIRNRVTHFTVRSAQNVMDETEITEFQFRGATVAHLLPAYLHDAHIAIVPLN